MSEIKSQIILALIRSIGALPLSVSRFIGSCLGVLSFRLNTRAARVTQKNLSICFPHLNDAERSKLTQQSLRETGKLAAEICAVLTQSNQKTLKLIKTSVGEEHVYQALEEGKGLLILAPHLGNWEVLGAALPRYASVINLYQPPKNAGLEALILTGRGASGASLAPTNAKGVAALLKQLKSNGIAGILPDQNPNERSGGDFASFFGESAFTMTLVYKLIQRTGCRAVFAYARREQGRFTLVFRKPPNGLYSKDVHESLKALNLGVENLVREAPAQYQWEYKRFKVSSPQRPVQHYA